MTADVASLTACVVVDCCSKTRDSNTPHIWPRRVDPAGQAGRARELSESAHLECFHPFKGSQPPLRPLARPYLTKGGHGGLVTTGGGPRGYRGPHTACHPSLIITVTLTQAPGQQSTGREWNYLHGMIVIQSTLSSCKR